MGACLDGAIQRRNKGVIHCTAQDPLVRSLVHLSSNLYLLYTICFSQDAYTVVGRSRRIFQSEQSKHHSRNHTLMLQDMADFECCVDIWSCKLQRFAMHMYPAHNILCCAGMIEQHQKQLTRTACLGCKASCRGTTQRQCAQDVGPERDECLVNSKELASAPACLDAI